MTKTEFSVDDRDYACWLVTEAIYKRHLFSKSREYIVLKPKEHLKQMFPADVHSIVNELVYDKRLLEFANLHLFTADKAKADYFLQSAYENIRLKIISDKFTSFYEDLKEIYGGAEGEKASSLQKLTLKITGLQQQIISYQKILFGVATDSYKQPLESDSVEKETAEAIHFAMIRALIPDAPAAKWIAEKLRDSIKTHRKDWKAGLKKKKKKANKNK